MEKNIIGKVLKKQRIKLNLTQGVFIQDILSVSQYSRIESGEQDIKSSDLLDILICNNIDINDFFSQISVEKSSLLQDILSEKNIIAALEEGFYKHNAEILKELKKNVTKLDPRNQLLNIISLVITILEGNTKSLPQNIKKSFSDRLNKSDHWVSDKDFLVLFGNTMIIFNMDRLDMYMRKILKFYENDISNYAVTVQKRIAGICINYLKRADMEQDLLLVNDVMTLISNLSSVPELLMFKLLGIYFKNVFTDNKNENKKILNLLSKSGYSNFIKNLLQ